MSYVKSMFEPPLTHFHLEHKRPVEISTEVADTENIEDDSSMVDASDPVAHHSHLRTRINPINDGNNSFNEDGSQIYHTEPSLEQKHFDSRMSPFDHEES